MKYAELAIYQAPGRQTYHYEIPPGLSVAVGQLVEVSFRVGRSQGIVLALSDTSPVPRTKPILDVLLPDPVVTPTQIALARWMGEETLSPLASCLWLTLPPGLSRKSDTLYTLLDPTFDDPNNLVIAVLRERGPLRGAQLDRALPKSGWRKIISPLIKQGVIAQEAISPLPDAKAHHVKTASLAILPDQLPATIESQRLKEKAAHALTWLAEQTSPVPVAQIAEQTGVDLPILRRLADKGLVTFGEAEQWRDPLAGQEFVATNPPILTGAQAEVWAQVRQHMEATVTGGEQARTYLLHGVTGSGKTEVYLRAIELVLAQGRQAIALVPEIALVPQTIRRFMARFPGRVAIVHSGLTDGEQYDTWRRARSGQIGVIVGARSALFSPLPDVGLVVLDEEHDDSYKQSPPLPPPYYHAREAAIAMMNVTRGTVILGSATPDLTTSFRAHRESITYLHLPDRVIVHRDELAEQAHHLKIPQSRYKADSESEAMTAELPPVKIVDMRQELRSGNRTMFSHALRTALNEVLALGEQAILFLNRRGTSTFILCRDCGYVMICPRCEMPLTYHQGARNDEAGGPLLCHHCGYRTPQPERCPKCESTRIRYFGAGTASVEEAVSQEFPQARILRWDRDTTHGRGAHDRILQQFAQGQANVLVGTQMIAKGLDIPRVTLVGVILADTSLGLPDYRAGERAFQLLTQVAGRAGRGWLGGRVIFQTYQPDHYAIRAAAKHDYETFYTQELEYRRRLEYPPFRRLVRFLFRYPNPSRAQQEAESLADDLRRRIAERGLTATDLIGPSPTFFGRIDDIYQWHIIARTTTPALLLEGVNPRQGLFIDIDPVEIL